MRRLLSRLEDERTGDIVLPELGAPVPPRHRANLEAVAAEFPDALGGELPTVPGLVLEQSSEAERLVARAWAPALAVTGMAGIPAPADAGNVLRPYTEAKVSLRLPPTVDATAAGAALVRILTADPPSGSRVTVTLDTCADGWVAPDPEPWVAAALARASLGSFGVPPSSYGEGGRSPSWPSWAGATRERRSWPPGSSGRAATPTAPTRPCTCRWPGPSRPPWPTWSSRCRTAPDPAGPEPRFATLTRTSGSQRAGARG